MTVRRLNLTTDPAGCATLHATAAPSIAAFWPGPVRALTATEMTALITQFGGWVSLSGTTRRAFIITRQHGIDGVENASEMWMWISNPALTAANFKAASKELIQAWWTDLQTRAVAIGWGLHVQQYPPTTEAVIQDWITRLGIVFETRPDADGYPWRLVKMSPQLALTKVAAW